MRMLKCYLGNNRDGHVVTTKDAMQSPGRIWTCTSCGCQLILHGVHLVRPRGLNMTSEQ